MKKLIFLISLIAIAALAQFSGGPTSLFSSGSSIGSIRSLGSNNIAQAPWSAVLAGRNNIIRGSDLSNGVAVITGGEDNLMDTNANTFAGNWKGDNKHAVIGGGQLNLINGGRYGTIAGGWENFISRSNTTIGGGWKNTNNIKNSTIAGGYKNVILFTNETAEGQQESSTIAGGYNNVISGGMSSVIGGGYENTIIGDSVAFAPHQNATIAGGAYNIVRGGSYNTIAGGAYNNISYGGNLGNGQFIGGGLTNIISGGNYSSIVGGFFNHIDYTTEYSFIGGGSFNTNAGLGTLSYIGGGSRNWISGGSTNAILFGNSCQVSADNAYALGVGITNDTEYSFEVGFSNTNKTRFNISGMLTLGASGESPLAITLAADNQSINTSRSYIRLSSDNGTAGNRTFVLTQGVFAGQTLDLEWVGTNAGELVDDSAQTGAGNHRLSATWTPTQHDVLALRFNGTDWVERSRSAN